MNCYMDQPIIVKEERIENSVENDDHDDTHYDKNVTIKEEKYDNVKVKNEVIVIKIEECENPVEEDAALSDQKCQQTQNKNIDENDKKDMRKTCKNKSNVVTDSYCGICDFTSISSVEVNQHLVQHCQDNVLNCQLCSFEGRDAAHMVSHRYKHCSKTEKQRYECPLCSEQFKNDYRLQYHYRSLHLKTKGGLCVVCGKTFLDLGRWKYHEKEHVATNYTCQHCNKGFVQRYKLKEHMAIHLNIFKYTCNFCGKGFRKSGNLKCHINSCHQTEHKQETCAMCGRTYKNEAALKRHMYEEHSQRKHICKACFKGFCTKRNLDKHIYNYHSDIKPYACEICGAAYRASWSLKNHKRTHTGELPYTCQECGKGFNSSSTCKRHQSVHTGVRAVKCLHCDKTFHSKKKMIAHCNAKHKDDAPDSNEEVIVNDFVTVLIKEERLENDEA